MRRLFLIMLLIVLGIPTLGKAQDDTVPCAPATIASLAVGSQAGVTSSQRLYAEPIGDEPWAIEPISTVPMNSVVTITAPPVCFEHTEWWKIEDSDTNLSGWVALSFRRYDADGKIILSGDPGLLPYEEVAGFERRVLPADVALGLGFSTGGALGGFLHDEECLMSYSHSLHSEQLAAVSDRAIFATAVLCDEGQNSSRIINSGDTVRLMAADISLTWWQVTDRIPTICYQNAETFVALSPDSIEMTVSTPDYHPCLDMGFAVAQLPLAAYRQSGVWQLQVDDYIIYIEVPIPEFPIFSDYIDADGQYTLWLGGFDPYERVVIFVGKPNPGTGAASFKQIYEVQTDANGYFVSSLPDQGGIFVAVGENGNVHWKGRCEGMDIYDEEDPNAACAERLYEYFWPEGEAE